ncbi:hypothetical protein ONS96_009455 [Cadophora gregata f. sp. sojae]|nr:hypothetical protein ONS96_009455 [Cadophora gregata f. sp. sojae]
MACEGLNETRSPSPKTDSSNHTSPSKVQSSSASELSDTTAQPTMTVMWKRKLEAHINTETAQGNAKRQCNIATIFTSNKTYQSPYPPIQNTQSLPLNEFTSQGNRQDNSSTPQSYQTFGPVAQPSPPVQTQVPAVNPIGVVGGVVLPVTEIGHHMFQGDVTIKDGPVTHNFKDQNIMQLPQPTIHQEDHWNNSQQPVNSQTNVPNTSGSDDFSKVFQYLDYDTYHPAPDTSESIDSTSVFQDLNHETHHPALNTFPSNVDGSSSHVGPSYSGSANVRTQFQDMTEQFPDSLLEQPLSSQPMSSTRDFNNYQQGFNDALEVVRKAHCVAPGPGGRIGNSYETSSTDDSQKVFPARSRGEMPRIPHNIFSAHPVKTAAGFLIKTAPQNHTEPHIPGSELTPVFNEPVRFRTAPNYSGKHNMSDMPFHIWQQGKDIIQFTYQSCTIQGRAAPSLTRLFDPEELRWLGKQAEEGKQRHSRKLHPVSMENLTYQFRERYCWDFEADLKYRLNDVLLKIQKTPTYYRVTRNQNLQPWVVGKHWRTVYLQTCSKPFNGTPFHNLYFLDWSKKWMFSVANARGCDRERALKEYDAQRRMATVGYYA